MSGQQTKCPRCGATNQAGNMFCGNCGSTLSKVCGNCWTPNPLENKYCLGCGMDLSTTRFSVPRDLVEQWASKFSQYKWPRQLGQKTNELVHKAAPAIDSQHETIIASTVIQGKYWLTKVVASGHAISAPWKNQQAGALIITNWRLLIADWLASTVYTYQYSQLQQADLSDDGPGKFPVFSLKFGSEGTVELHRARMAKFPFPFPSPYLVAATAAAADAIKHQQAENAMVDSFFQFLVSSRK